MIILPSRRIVLGSALFFTVPGLFAEELTKTPKQTEGPFYPTKLPLDTDNDLIIINDAITPGLGEISHLSGKVVDLAGKPVKNACVEIWQCDNAGAYLHSGSDNGSKRDKNFQGFGRFVTSSTGEFYFRTIKPVPYPGRTPHIHVKVKRGGKELLTTQLYVKDHPGNARDGIYSSIKDPKAKALITGEYLPVPNSKLKELAVSYTIVLGLTPEMD
jgi:protocatechuate 3,4-dioxygenase, beta subunit